VLKKTGGISVPTQYCFDPDDSALRYVRGEGWYQTVYNDIVAFQEGHLAKEVEVTDGGHPYLKLRITKLETVPQVDENDLIPPAAAVNLQGKRITDVSLKLVQTTFPEWPAALQQQHFSITVQIVVGKNGQVTEAHAISGPPNAYKSAEATVKKMEISALSRRGRTC
jgi:hypothetical protein